MHFPDVLAGNLGIKIFFYFFMQNPNEFNFLKKNNFFLKIKKIFFEIFFCPAKNGLASWISG